jgi:predicted phage terminase large subunit-like protein
MEIKKLLSQLNRAWRFLPHTLAENLSGGNWQPYIYLTMISHLISESVAKGNGRLIVSLPPRHGKSELISHWVPVWFLENWPNQNVILTSYEADFAATWGRKVRDTIQSNQNELTVSLSSDSLSASRWNTTQGGGMVTAGAGGPITGRGGNLIIVDDPLKNWMEAQSETIRNRLIEWFYSTLYTRAEPGATIIIVQTRWHEADLVGELLDSQPNDWHEIRLPAIAETDGDMLNRIEGQALCPDRFDEKALDKIKQTIGSAMFEALYQQNPSSPQGEIFKRSWWKYFDPKCPPTFLARIQSWDCAYETGKDKSYSVCQTWGIAENGFYLLDQYRERLQYPDLVKAVKNIAERFEPDRILIEYQASGRSLVQDLYQRTRLPLKAIKTGQTSKETRAWLVTALVESGKVFLPKQSSWLDQFLHEMTMFPNSRYMDQVDALSQALIFLKDVRFSKRRRPSTKELSSTGRKGRRSERRRRRSRLYYGPKINIAATWLGRNDTH